MFPRVFLLVVGLVVPAFFLGIYVSGTYHRLASLRQTWRDLRDMLRSGRLAPEEQAAARARQERVSADYETLRQSFPSRLVAALFRCHPLGTD